jgi:hypothetical protein
LAGFFGNENEKRMEAGWVIERRIWSLGGVAGDEMESGWALRKQRMEVG